jgi:hypothetical protein
MTAARHIAARPDTTSTGVRPRNPSITSTTDLSTSSTAWVTRSALPPGKW